MERERQNETRLIFNGINGATGEYGLPPMTGKELSQFITGEARPENLNELKYRYRQETERHLGVREGVDPDKLEEAGWGIIFSFGVDPAIREALSELIELREEQAGQYFQVFEGPDAYRPGESKTKFLARHGVGPGPADPTKVPYYLLIVGSPQDIPYQFQYELDVQYAVGRLYCETLEEYASYARSVVMAERGEVKLPRRAAFFGVAHPDDDATEATTSLLVDPLSRRLREVASDWEVTAVLRNDAVKKRLSDLLGGGQTPALLMTASHGLEFPLGHPRQIPHQGALLCHDWPGPEAWTKGQPIPQDFYFAGDDLSKSANLMGLFAFFFACYGGGTPLNDEFSKRAFKERKAIAPHPFVAGLPTRMLGHPRGGALAVVGHVERAWSLSFRWPGAGAQTVVFESVLDRLLSGSPVGAAMEYFDARWAELSTVLSNELEDIEFGKQFDPYDLADMWTANNDARSYVILGDPAVRLPVATPGEVPGERPGIRLASVETPLVEKGPQAAASASVPDVQVGAEERAQAAAPTSLSLEAGSAALPDLGAIQEETIDSLRTLSRGLTEMISTALDDLGRLQVRTFGSENPADAVYDREARAFGGEASLWAETRIEGDGDVVNVFPSQAIRSLEEGNVGLLSAHQALVDSALSHRGSFLESLARVLSTLFKAMK